MASDGHLCDLCSEIFDEPGQLQDHLLADHDIKREAELDIDTTECIQSDPNEEVELYDPLPVMEDDDIEDETYDEIVGVFQNNKKSKVVKKVDKQILEHSGGTKWFCQRAHLRHLGVSRV